MYLGVVLSGGLASKWGTMCKLVKPCLVCAHIVIKHLLFPKLDGFLFCAMLSNMATLPHLPRKKQTHFQAEK